MSGDRLEQAAEHLELARLLRERDEMRDPRTREQYLGHLATAKGTIDSAISAHERAEAMRGEGDG